MTLVRAGQPRTGEPEVLPEVPGGIPRDGNGKPKIRVADQPGKFRSYRRASSYAKPVENDYLLGQWAKRAVAFGLGRTPALVTRSAAVPKFKDVDDEAANRRIRDELQAIASDAMDVARTGDRAMHGTALHALSEAADRGDDLSHLDSLTKRAVDRWLHMMSRFEILGTEQFTVNDEFGLGGSYDRLVRPLGVMRGPDGEVRLTPDDVVGVDLKSGADARYFGPCYAGQQAGYFGGVPYVHVDAAAAVNGDNGRRDWPGGVTPNQRWSLIPHIPVERPDEAGLMWVDLQAGRWSLKIARDLYEARRLAGTMFGEAELPEVEQAQEPSAPVVDESEAELDELLGLLASAPDLAAVGVLHSTRKAIWTDECTQVVKDRIAAGELKRGEAA